MKTAIVTGSSSGIGLAIAQELVREGWNVTLNGILPHHDAELLCASFREQNKGDVYWHDADLSDPEQARALVEDTLKIWGQVDLLVNNAGIQHVAPVEDFPLEMWHKILSVNLSACFYTIQAVLPAMKFRKKGRIVNLASVHGLVGSVHKSAYVAAKHGLVGLTKVVALETAGTGITCNALCPGWVLTPLVEKQIRDRAAAEHSSVEEATRQLLAEKQPSGAFVQPGNLARMVIFLASDDACQMTGAIVPVDGGWTAR